MQADTAVNIPRLDEEMITEVGHSLTVVLMGLVFAWCCRHPALWLRDNGPCLWLTQDDCYSL